MYFITNKSLLKRFEKLEVTIFLPKIGREKHIQNKRRGIMVARIYEREKLYKEVWAVPMTTLAKRYGVSDTALRKQCEKMNIPLPKAGHWAKVKAGHKVIIPLLPKSDVPDKVVVTAQAVDSAGRKLEDLLLFLPEDRRESVKKYCLSVTVQDKLTKPHELIMDTKQYYQSKKGTTKPPMNRVIEINVSDEQKDRLYRFYDAIFKALEHLGYTVEIKEPKYRGYYRRNELLICLNEDSVPIFIKEKQKRIEYSSTKESMVDRYGIGPSFEFVKTGKLHFGIDSYHAKRKNWNDTETKKIEKQIGEIILWIMEAIHVEKVKREEHEAKKQLWLEEQKIQEQKTEKKEKELKQLELLEQYAQNWERADRIRKLSDTVELKFAKVGTKEEKQKINDWVKWARKKADYLDPLFNTDDEILGQGDWLFNLIDKDFE